MTPTGPWYAVVDDLIGGWAVANRNQPLSEFCFDLNHRDFDPEVYVIADMVRTKKDAERIARLLNAEEAA